MCQMSAQTEAVQPRGMTVEKKRRVGARRREISESSGDPRATLHPLPSFE